MGGLYLVLGQDDKAREAFRKCLTIAERLTQAEPDRVDYQVDLANSLALVGSVAGSRELLVRRPQDA